MTLEQVVADAREEAQILRRNGHVNQAASLERLCELVQAAGALYLEWVPEGAAKLRSGKGVDYFRARFAQWERDGLAKLEGRTRYYRGVVVPRRVLGSLVRAEAAREPRQVKAG